MKDYYYILGLDKTASESEIKEVYRKLSKKFHPDLNPNDAHAEKMFKDIQEAYECLDNYQTRHQYDNSFENSSNSQSNFTGENYSSNIKPKKIIEVDKEGAMITIVSSLVIGFFAAKLLIDNSGGGNKEHWLSLSILGALALTVFMTPFHVAIWKRQRLKWVVLGGTLILGWTGLGWLGCLLFAIYGGGDD